MVPHCVLSFFIPVRFAEQARHASGNKKCPRQKAEAPLLFVLRKERDSNPRTGKPVNGFRDRPIQPLWHLSEKGCKFTDSPKLAKVSLPPA
jgi:hypothetical protein